jgi:phosphatidylserine decarboxylase
MKDQLFDMFMPLLPKNDLSHLVGRLVHLKLPAPLARASVQMFANAYHIDMTEAEHPIGAYLSIGELFTRKLRPGVRPIGKSLVHPADALISQAGTIEKLTLIQAKGKTYTVSDLIRSPHFAPFFEGGGYLTYYLCPTDYHRVHSPVDGLITWSTHIPGTMWPVNEWSVNSIPNLFSVNERVAVIIETPHGRAALVMVAATNVGNMTMSFDENIESRKRRTGRAVREQAYHPAKNIACGDELGIFHMGSTVVMLYEKKLLASLGIEDVAQFAGRHVKYGESLLQSERSK